MKEDSEVRFFKHDVFISYAHRDNENGCVAAFHAQLAEYLQSALRREPSVWRDALSLEALDDLENKIRSALATTAILIFVVSSTVESRKWCRDEMGWFLNGAELDRVVVQRLYPVFVSFDDVDSLPRWVKDLPYNEPRLVLDPNRSELFADQDMHQHQHYWDCLYGWFDSVSRGIVRAHCAFAEHHA